MKKFSLFAFIVFSLYTIEAQAGTAESGVSAPKDEIPSWAVKERRNLARTRETLAEWNIPFEERPLLENYGGFGTSVFVRISGAAEGSAERNEGTFVLALPLYGDFAVDTGLAAIDAAQRKTPRSNIIAAFLGDEKTALPVDSGGVSHKGLRDLLSAADMPDNWALCFLDFDERPAGITIRHGDGDYIAPMEMVRPLPSLFGSQNIKTEFEIRYNELYRLDLAGRNDELALSWEAGVNGVSLGPRGNAGEAGISSEKLAELLLDYSEEIDFPLQDPERYYSFYGFSGLVFFVGEKASVLIIIVLVGLLLLFILAYFTRLRRRAIFGLKFFLRYSWLFLLFLPILIFAIKGSSLFYGLLLSVFNKPVPDADFTGTLLSALFGLCCFAIVLRALNVLRIPVKGNFYGFSALFLTFLGFLIMIFLDFTYATVFLWALFLSFLGFFSSKPLPVLIAALLIPLPALGALVNLYEAGALVPSGVFMDFLGRSNWALSFQISLAALPSVMLLKKAVLLLKWQKRKTRDIPNAVYLAVSGLAVSLLLVHAMILPGPGPAPIRRLIEIEDDDSLLAVSLSDTVFQESRILRLDIKARGNPARFDVFLESGGGRAAVYSVPVPIEENEEGVLSLALGENPPNPFRAQLVLSRNFAGFVRVEALYTGAAETAKELLAEEAPLDPGADCLLRIRTRRKIPESPTS